MPITFYRLMRKFMCFVSFAYSCLLGLKAWWLDEPTVIERNPPEDIPASKGRLIVLMSMGWS